jgi:hypothetical protein
MAKKLLEEVVFSQWSTEAQVGGLGSFERIIRRRSSTFLPNI